MRFKHLVVVAFVGTLALLTAACSDDAGDACEHQNDICAGKTGFTALNCDQVEKDYEKRTDAEKEQRDKVIECIMDTDDCDTAIRCSVSTL